MNQQSRNRSLATALLLLFFALPARAQEDLPIPRVTGQRAAGGTEVQLNQIDASAFPRVVLFATVLKEGVPLPGLGEADFRVREDEVDQEPLTVVAKRTKLSVVLTLDTSGSMAKRIAEAQAAAKSFLETLAPEDGVQVIRFSRDVRTIYPFGTDRGAARAAIGGTVARGDTALWDAVHASVEALRRVAGRKAIVLLSDGVDDDGSGGRLSTKTVADVLAAAAQVNVPVYAIGLGTELDELNLRRLADESGGRYLSAADPAELGRLYESIGAELSGQYAIDYTSKLPADGGEHRLELEVADSSSTKNYRSPARVAAAAAPITVRKLVRKGSGTLDFHWPGNDVWMVYRGKETVSGRGHRGAEKVVLQVGEYTVKPVLGAPFEPFDVEIRPGQTTTVRQRAGTLDFRWPGNDVWMVYRGTQTASGRGHRSAEKVVLQAGKYTVKPVRGTPFEPLDIEIRDSETLVVEP